MAGRMAAWSVGMPLETLCAAVRLADLMFAFALADLRSGPFRARRKSQELGEYGDAILTCVQCFQGMDSLRQLAVSAGRGGGRGQDGDECWARLGPASAWWVACGRPPRSGHGPEPCAAGPCWVAYTLPRHVVEGQ